MTQQNSARGEEGVVAARFYRVIKNIAWKEQKKDSGTGQQEGRGSGNERSE